MLHFRFDMPVYLMALYGSIMILIVLLFRGLLKNRLPRFVFPILWSVVLLRLLLPFSISSPLSAPVPSIPLFEGFKNLAFAEETTVVEGTGSAINADSDNTENSDRSARPVTEYVASNAASFTETASETGTATVIEESASFRIPDALFNLSTILLVIYLSGAAGTFAILLLQKHQYSRRLKNRLLLEQNETINGILRDMNMGHVLVFSNDEIASPLVCGLLHPCIYLPTRMDFSNTELLRHILAHETMHIKRKDNWLKALMLTALCLHWYNPLAWLMSGCFSSDLEAACDAAVLKGQDGDYRKSYAASLLAMAITGNRPTLLYSSFSRTAVEKRIRSVLSYRKAGVCMLLFSALFLSAQTLVFATAGQGPFSPYLSSFCSSDNCRWGAKAELTRDIFTGRDAQKRANDVILHILSSDRDNDSELLRDRIITALSEEFGVEKSAFALELWLCLDPNTLTQEYSEWEIQEREDGFYLYQGQSIRAFHDPLTGCYQVQTEGEVDLTVNRNRFGEITSLTVNTVSSEYE